MIDVDRLVFVRGKKKERRKRGITVFFVCKKIFVLFNKLNFTVFGIAQIFDPY